jgi:putative oxidoreductase
MHIIAIIGQIIFGAYWFNAGISHFKNLGNLTGYAAAKGTPKPKLAVIISGILLLLGGLGILLGVYIWWSILALVLFLIPTTLMIHNFWKDTDPMQKMNNRIGFMKNTALLAALFMFWTMPVLAYSLFF